MTEASSVAIRTVLVAHDGSRGAAFALDWAIGFARQAGARLVIVHAWSPLDDLGKRPGPADFQRLHADALRTLRDEWCRDLPESGVEFECRLAEDLPIPGIVTTAREVHADLIVCGTRGRGRVRELLLGSVARGLPEGSHIPVTIVPPPVSGTR
jgi:nucleotide-binding universal stress UspA family protein